MLPRIIGNKAVKHSIYPFGSARICLRLKSTTTRLQDLRKDLRKEMDSLRSLQSALQERLNAIDPLPEADAPEPKIPEKNPRGFVDFVRNAEPYRPARERARDWAEINTIGGHQDPLERKRQAARCMDCGTPFCMTNTGCPINNLIPEWNALVLNDEWKLAIERLHHTNNFPEFTGRVCPAPCEGGCVAGLIDESVTIKNIEYSIVERAWEEGWIVPRPVAHRSGRRVAVVGSGPAGLAAADELNQLGHSVTVLEREDKIGGLLYYGIPNMKLDKGTVDRRVGMLAEEGIEFRTGVHVGATEDSSLGNSMSPDELLADYDAVVLAVGATKPRDLPIEGRDLGGIHFAMDFLTANQKDLAPAGEGGFANRWGDGVISAQGKHVVVIGGGDTGTDCIGTSVRHLCKSMVNLELMPTPPPVRDPVSNPWPDWPRIFRVDYGHEEACATFGSDPRTFSVMSKEFVGDGHGNVKALRITTVESRDGQLIEVPGTEREIPADLVLLAMGFVGPEDSLAAQLELERDASGNIKAEHGAYYTSRDGVFAAGDCRRGQSLVVWAINEGRGVAQTAHEYLSKIPCA